MKQLVIDEEFKYLLPSLDEDTYAQLEKDLINDGCRDNIVVWGDIIIDGHNRYEICSKYDIPFTTAEKDFMSKEEALIWIITTQISRRNLTQNQLSYFRGLHYSADKWLVTNSQGRNQYSEVGGQNDHQPKISSTASRLSEQYRVSPKTIRRDAKVAEAISAIGAVSPEAKRSILSGKTNISRKDLQELAEVPPKEIIYVAAEIENGTYKKAQPPIHQVDDERSSDDPYYKGMDPLKATLIRLSDGFSSDLRSLNVNGGPDKLRKALKAYIDVLDDIYDQM